MKIAVVTEGFHPYPGGVERRYWEIYRRLSKRHTIDVFTQLRRDSVLTPPYEEKGKNLLIHRLAKSKYYGGVANRRVSAVFGYSAQLLGRLLTKNDYDAYDCNGFPFIPPFVVKMFSALRGTPLVTTMHEVWGEDWVRYFPTISKLGVMIEKTLPKIATYVVAVSHFTKLRIIEKLGVQRNKVGVIPNGVEYDKFSKGSHKKVWGKIVYVGRLFPHKHVDLLMEAFRRVRRETSEVELHIVGSGVLLPLIERKASRLEGCFVYGFVPDERMVSVLKDSWLFVLPSEREGSGIAALEAMAAGIPVVTTNYPSNATKELVSHGNGMVVEPTSQHIASAIRELLSEERDWQEMSRNARSFAARFDWDKVADDMERLLRMTSSKVRVNENS